MKGSDEVLSAPSDRCNFVERLLYPKDEDGNALEPLITLEQAKALLDLP